MTHSIMDAHASLVVDKQGLEVVSRAEFLDQMTFAQPGRGLFNEIYGLLPGVKEAWIAEGATPAEGMLSAFRYRDAAYANVPVNTGWLGGDEEVILEETEEYIIARDARGRRLKLCKGMATLPLPLDYPVHTMADWLSVRQHYEFSEERFAAGWADTIQAQAAAGRVISISLPGAFWEPRELMGDVDLCVTYYTQPQVVYNIIETLAETACRVLERVTTVVQVDRIVIAEDLAGKSGPLIGPRQFKQFVAPYYRRVWDLLSSRGARLFLVDTDGNCEALIPSMIDAGVNALQPMEPAAGMDVVALRHTYGKSIAFNGGIDKHVLRRNATEIDAELEYKLPPMVRTGGGVLGLDHRVTNGTSIAAYRHYIAKAWQIIEREEARL